MANVQNTAITQVSIPYGSIKSFDEFGDLIAFSVSIPYGSIKSRSCISVGIIIRSFNSLWFD